MTSVAVVPAVVLAAALLLVAPASAPHPVRAVAPGGDATGPAFARPPLEPAVLVTRFTAPPERWSAGHRGVDLRAAPGTPVLAPADGVVAYSGVVVDRGVVTVLHPSGLLTSFEPVTGAPPLGTEVEAGDVLATVAEGASHCPPPDHCLHWGVRDGETYVDPLLRLPGGGPVVLLPLG